MGTEDNEVGTVSLTLISHLKALLQDEGPLPVSVIEPSLRSQGLCFSRCDLMCALTLHPSTFTKRGVVYLKSQRRNMWDIVRLEVIE
jgi:hypothetical protein